MNKYIITVASTFVNNCDFAVKEVMASDYDEAEQVAILFTDEQRRKASNSHHAYSITGILITEEIEKPWYKKLFSPWCSK